MMPDARYWILDIRSKIEGWFIENRIVSSKYLRQQNRQLDFSENQNEDYPAGCFSRFIRSLTKSYSSQLSKKVPRASL